MTITDSLSALQGALRGLQAVSQKWCDNLGGQLNFSGSTRETLEVTIHKVSPYKGGCPGDVTVTSLFTCTYR